MSTNALLHHLFPWSSAAMAAVMNDKQGTHVLLGSLLLFVKYSAKVLGSVLVVIIEALFWVFQLIKLMLGAFLAHFLHFVVD